jgi:hypothetical protein
MGKNLQVRAQALDAAAVGAAAFDATRRRIGQNTTGLNLPFSGRFVRFGTNGLLLFHGTGRALLDLTVVSIHGYLAG